jgi:hypothetical protein
VLHQRLALCRDRPPAAGTHGDKRRCTGAQARADQLRAPLEHRRRPAPDAADSPRDRARGGGAAPRSDPGGDSQTRIAARARATRTGVGAPPRSTMDPGGGRAAAPAPRAQPGPPRRAARTLRRRRLQTLVRDRAARPRPALPSPHHPGNGPVARAGARHAAKPRRSVTGSPQRPIQVGTSWEVAAPDARGVAYTAAPFADLRRAPIGRRLDPGDVAKLGR